MNIVVAGGTGFIGTALVERLAREHHAVTVLTRHPARVSVKNSTVRAMLWDARTVGAWAEIIYDADAVMNLTGELIAGKRWTTSQKELILSSRVDATQAIVSAIKRSKKKPSVLINFSGAGYYGNVPAGDVTESSSKGNDFLSDVCDRWESAARTARELGVRVITPRLGVVLGTDGGALPRLLLPFKLYAGGYLGSGKQWFPLIHRKDVINALLFFLKEPSIAGPVNLAAPDPVTMKEFCQILGDAVHKPSWAAVPSFVLRIILGEMAEMLLTGQRVVPKRLFEAGFVFAYPTLRSAMSDLVTKLK